MSKADKNVKANTTLLLKKELDQAGKVIQGLAISLEKHENNISAAETALANERSLKEELSLAQKDTAKAREAQMKAQHELADERALFADVNLKLTREYGERLNKLQAVYESKLKEFKQNEEFMNAKWKEKVEYEKAETCRLKEAENHGRSESEAHLRKERETWQKKEERLQNSLRQHELQIGELTDRNKTLSGELVDQHDMLKGRVKEMQKLESKVAALEAFPSQDITDRVTEKITKLQTSLREFCLWCVESAETLPWNQFPKGIRYNYLPKLYSSDSSSGRYVLVAAIQHSICTAMTRNFPPPLGPYTGRGWDVSEPLFQKNQAHEAIWRLMTVNTILGDQKMMDKYKANLHDVARSLLLSWNPFPGDGQEKETLDRLTRLLIESATTSLELLKLRRRIHVSVHMVSDYFDSDSEEDVHKVPGGYALPDSTTAVLCLFPAFFWTASPAATLQSSLLRKGTAMFRDSPPLLAALNDEHEARSPNIGSKRSPTT